MGLYSPQSLVAGARRHGVLAREPDIINASPAHATLEPDSDRTGSIVLRLGLADVRHLGETVADLSVTSARP